ncbi:MAG TPA: pitrilysin family protein [Roseateles sp.]|nr:pitrilysin family protein [Roseateles sp.]
MDLPDIPFERFQLDNGLTVIVHEDHKAPVVAVSIWYHVGSADEPTGKTGFAHLFEHLMFSGSEHHRELFFKPFELAGATDQNGTTWFDRTNYFQTVPTTALDMALWMESDRMGHLLGAIGQQELDTQLGVVKNEKRQNEGQPYGRAFEHIHMMAFPANHPYRHQTIGSMEDLDGASLDDVRAWFRAYYGAANAVLVLAGDITPALAREKVQQYFGDIEAGPPVARQMPWVAARAESTRGLQRDRVPQLRILREWNVTGQGKADTVLLELAAWVLGGDVSSRLYQRLVQRERLADAVSVGLMPFALAGMFVLSVNVCQGVDPAAVETAIAEEWAQFLNEGPSEDELLRARMVLHADLVRQLEKVGGFAGKAVILAEGQLYRGDPAAYRSDLALREAATPACVQAAARRWLAQGDHTLTILPSAEMDEVLAGLPASPARPAPRPGPASSYKTVASRIDRRRGVPAVDRFPALTLPPVHRARLPNGLRLELLERRGLPQLQMQLHIDAGLAAEQGAGSGVARLAMSMLTEGSETLDALEIARRQQRLGMAIQAFTQLDSSGVAVSALSSHLGPALDLAAELVRLPAYRDADLERLRAQMLSAIRRDIANPTSVGQRLLPGLLYGRGHAYGAPSTGHAALLASVSRAELSAFHGAWVRPDRMTLFVVGDTTLETLLPLLEASFGDWRAPLLPAPEKHLAKVVAPGRPRLRLIDRPGPQSQISAGRLIAPSGSPQTLPMQLANGVFGGLFSSRLNLNLREDKRWTYGARSGAGDAVGQRAQVLSTSVQADRTADSMAEIMAELAAIAGDRPPTTEELRRVKAQSIRTLPGSYESSAGLLETLVGNQRYGRPDDHAQTLAQRIEAVDADEVAAVARDMFAPSAFCWTVAGELRQIENSLRTLGIADVEIVAEAELD